MQTKTSNAPALTHYHWQCLSKDDQYHSYMGNQMSIKQMQALGLSFLQDNIRY